MLQGWQPEAKVAAVRGKNGFLFTGSDASFFCVATIQARFIEVFELYSQVQTGLESCHVDRKFRNLSPLS